MMNNNELKVDEHHQTLPPPKYRKADPGLPIEVILIIVFLSSPLKLLSISL
jgi:hypothetical protein